eukprot:CAMPEP_0181123944 /NCGR_PEP_ID=MMETSP1071-20121207/26195_1 /TAXON_ID=35127 /ORGANISM="Thalassiosira sp., Strain NH16" /LENGTH=629 /DNA_ID=CAMNT_0023209171 /DNA_START=221 /DNA_END=2110 /DNA_ORIENTATION=+
MGSAHSSQSSLVQGTAIVKDISAVSAATASSNFIEDNSLHSNSHGSILPQQQVTKQHLSYIPPSSPTQPLAHYVFLVHGWLGNDLEFAYLSQAFRRIISPEGVCDSMDVPDCVFDSISKSDANGVQRSGSYLQASLDGSTEEEMETGVEVIIHGVKCNVGKTHDGIRNGGTRVANEVIEFIKADVHKRLVADKEQRHENGNESNNEIDANHAVTFSLIGNSLGGLYSRYAVSLLPYQLQLEDTMLNLHPNIFCTTATPHLGVSQHTFLPIPRIAEKIIGTGMGETGRDLFRLNSEKDLSSAAVGNIMNAAVGGVRRLSSFRRKSSANIDGTGNSNNPIENNGIDEEELECIIHNMCLEENYLAPLRNFRQRIAYANAYGTDFQVPTTTAAFLNEKSEVGHFVLASRGLPHVCEEKEKQVSKEDIAVDHSFESKTGAGNTGGEQMSVEDTEDKNRVPSFIVAVVRTQQQSQPQLPTESDRDDMTSADESLRMSQSLDALGWTKVFIDVQDRVPGVAKPAWMRPPCDSLDELIRERSSWQPTDTNDESIAIENNATYASKLSTHVQAEQCILTSRELAQSTMHGDSINFPMGHGVMVANSKNEKYSQANSQGRPVMDRLAKDMVHDVLEFE